MRRFASVLPLLLVAWPAASSAQPPKPALAATGLAAAATDHRMLLGTFPIAPGPVRNGIVGSLPIARNLDVAVGRFVVLDPPRPRNHMEAEQRSGEVRRRDRGIAAVGLSFRF
jgi:hypothetical protein